MALYIALILVSAGLGLILFALFAESGRRYSLPVRDRFVPNYDLADSGGRAAPGSEGRAARDVRDDKLLDPDDYLVTTRRDRPVESPDLELYGEPQLVDLDEPSSGEHKGILDELEGEFSREHARESLTTEAPQVAPEESAAPEPPVQSNVAYLYEDSSEIVDYEQNTNVIDPTMGQYKRLKRVGKGLVQVVKDGINFQIGKSMFRFDFYKIEKAKVGDNFIALFLRGGSTVRLLIFDENSPARIEVKKGIESYFSAA
ncbi:MAG: hypothetical protein EPN93_09905 [Spirochaetes bacterium]|nr:MAG: hypothetical protein EPN93_09905 [Spirochaetota bacterium]